MFHMNFLLKQYAAWAGLEAEKVTYTSLRHTARMLHGLVKVSRYSREYLKGMAAVMEAAEKRGKPQGRGPYPRKPCGTPPGNQNSLKYGLYAKEPSGDRGKAEMAGNKGTGDRGRAMERLRWVIRRSYELGQQAETARQLATLLEVMGSTLERLDKLCREMSKRANKSEGSSAAAWQLVRNMEAALRQAEETRDDKLAGNLPSRQEIDELRKSLLGDAEQQPGEQTVEQELKLLDEMIGRAEQMSRENLRLDEGLALLNALSTAVMRRRHCTARDAEQEKSPDEKLKELTEKAMQELYFEVDREEKDERDGNQRPGRRRNGSRMRLGTMQRSSSSVP